VEGWSSAIVIWHQRLLVHWGMDASSGSQTYLAAQAVGRRDCKHQQLRACVPMQTVAASNPLTVSMSVHFTHFMSYLYMRH